MSAADADRAGELFRDDAFLFTTQADDVAPELQAAADALAGAFTNLAALPELYSTRADAVVLGSAADELFFGPAAKAAWQKFIGYNPRMKFRGGLRAALVEPEVGWRIVVSHDSVSLEPAPAVEPSP